MENPLSGDWTLPKIGKVKKIYVVGAVGLTLGAAVYTIRKRKAASLAATSGSSTDAAGNVGTIDPTTGYVAGSPQDLAALNTGSGDTGSGTGGGGGDSSGGGTTADQVTAGPPFTNNAAWAQYVTAYLVDNLDQDPGAVATDIGSYLAGALVTQAQKDVIQEATAYAGQPPVAGPNGYPPSINVSGSISGTGSAPGAVKLVAGTVTSTAAEVTWTAVTGATGYAWKATGPSYSKTGIATTGTVTITGLKPSSSYAVAVHATNSHGAGPSATLTVKTKAAAGSSPAPTPAPSASYAAVKVVKFVAAKPAWNSTISGIAAHYGYGTNWQTVWNDSHNAALRAKRGTPEKVQPGDTVQVKRK